MVSVTLLKLKKFSKWAIVLFLAFIPSSRYFSNPSYKLNLTKTKENVSSPKGEGSLNKKQVMQAFIESPAWYHPKYDDLLKSAAASVSLDTRLNENVFDIRGVGDSGWTHENKDAKNHEESRLPAVSNVFSKSTLGSRRFFGDFNFMNWESVVGKNCIQKNPNVDFYFISHPKSVVHALYSGFNAFSVSNNHVKDCLIPYGPQMIKYYLDRLVTGENKIWHGSGKNSNNISISTYVKSGKRIKVAMASLLIAPWVIQDAASLLSSRKALTEALPWLEKLKNAPVDLRILSIHTQDSSEVGRPEGESIKLLKSIGEEFILNYSGDVVFGHGPHTLGGVKLVRSRNGNKTGVIFVSLGNFIHPGVSFERFNYVGRAVFDLHSLRLSEVQVLPFANTHGPGIRWLDVQKYYPMTSNFIWQEDKSQNLFYAPLK